MTNVIVIDWPHPRPLGSSGGPRILSRGPSRAIDHAIRAHKVPVRIFRLDVEMNDGRTGRSGRPKNRPCFNSLAGPHANLTRVEKLEPIARVEPNRDGIPRATRVDLDCPADRGGERQARHDPARVPAGEVNSHVAHHALVRL